MAIPKNPLSVARGVASTAAKAARHPVSTASVAAGLVKGTVDAGVSLVRHHHADDTAPADTPVEQEASLATEVESEPTAPPKPEVVAFDPEPDDLPEPIVIEALPDPEPEPEPVHIAVEEEVVWTSESEATTDQS